MRLKQAVMGKEAAELRKLTNPGLLCQQFQAMATKYSMAEIISFRARYRDITLLNTENKESCKMRIEIFEYVNTCDALTRVAAANSGNY